MANRIQRRRMEQALDAEIVRLERVVASGGLIVAFISLPMAVYISVAIDKSLGRSVVVFVLALLFWFLIVRGCLDRGIGGRLFQWTNPFIEITVPTIMSIIDVTVLGATYALHQTIPLQLYTGLTLLSVLRLKRFMPLLVASVGALEYAAVYAFIMRPGLPPELLDSVDYRWDIVGIRCVFIVLGGALGTMISHGLRSAASKAEAEIRSHELFGKYRLGDLIGSGGMGEVYRATYCPEGGFRRPVALKRIHPHLARELEFVQKFRNEAELSSRLIHPNIVQVLDFGRIEDTYFLAMEYVDGVTLGELADRCRTYHAPIPPRVVGLLGRDICRGLRFAHEIARDDTGQVLRVVHRDLSPSNVLVSRAGEVKILDFGVARALRDSTQAHTGTVTGKIAYMAPEQINDAPFDNRSDLFAVGVLLWELLCLEPLFKRSSDGATLLAVLQDPIPLPSSRRTGLETGWDAFISKALEREADARFQTARAMSNALDELIERDGAPGLDEVRDFVADVIDGGAKEPLADRVNLSTEDHAGNEP